MGSAVDRILTEQAQQGTGNIDLGQSPSKVDSILTARPSVDDILTGQAPYDPNRLLPRQVPLPAESNDPGIMGIILEALKEQGRSLVQFGKYAITSGYSPGMPITAVTSGKVAEDIRAASMGDKEAEQRLRRGLEGAALTTSTLAAGGLASAIKPAVGAGAPLLKRAAAWLAAEELGAITYGSISPLEDDETRAEAIKEDMIQFPIAGAAMHGIFKAAKLVFKGFRRPLDQGLEDALKGMGKQDAEATAKRALEIVQEAGNVPPKAETWIHSEAAAQAVKERLAKVKRQPTATARIIDEPPDEGPDFTVEINQPPKPPPVNPIGTDLAQAVAESEAARVADIPSGITTPRPDEPLGLSVVKNEDGSLIKMYHGTKADFRQYDPIKFGVNELYGPGIYHTDNPDIASGYSLEQATVNALKTRQANVERGEKNLADIRKRMEGLDPASPQYQKLEASEMDIMRDLKEAREGVNVYSSRLGSPNLRPAFLDIRNPFDIEKVYTIGDINAKFSGIGVHMKGDLSFEFMEDPTKKLTGQEVYDELVRHFGDKEGANMALQAAGYDGITHIGGQISDGVRHRVAIAFSPEQVHTPWSIELQRVMAQAAREPGDVADAAVADAVADAVVAETRVVDIMPPSLAQEAVNVASIPGSDVVEEVVKNQAVREDLYSLVERAVNEGLIDEGLGLALRRTILFRGLGGEPISKRLKKLAGERLSYEAFAKQQGWKTAPLHAAIADDILDLAKIAEGFESGHSNPIGDLGSGLSDAGAGSARQQWARLDKDQMDALRRMLERFLRSESGAISSRAATRIAATALSGVSFYAAEQQDDPMAEALLNTVGGILALGSLVPGKATKKWIQETNFPYAVVKAFAADRIASDGTKKGMQEWQALRSQGTAFAKQLEVKLREAFPDDLSKRAAMYSLDEGPAAPEFATLTPDQQREVASQAVLNNVIGRILTQMGIIQNPRMHYVRHLFQDKDTQNLWYSQWKQLGQSGQFARQRQFETLREAERWAQSVGRKGPTMDPTKVQGYHVIEVVKAISNRRIIEAYERLGLLQDLDESAIAASQNLAPRDRLRQVRITNLGGSKMAPDDAATVLERAADGAAQFGLDHQYWQALDAAKAQLMRGIMFWAWEHGINVWRGAMAIDGTGVAYMQALKRVKAADPVVLEASKYTNLYHRPDFGPEGQTLFDKAMAKLGTQYPTLAKIGTGFEHWRERGERQLWDEWVPALGLTTWSKEMHQWTKRTGGRHLLGSPEYEAAAQQAGKMASNAMGKIPELVQSPTVAFIMRQILFSPQWTRGRIAIMAHATGELQKIASGEINPREARYLAYKLRSLLLAATLTAVGSYALTQEWPQFNPNTLKFYVKTGVKDHNGREIGVDLTGWWQDDLKVYNDPWAFVRDRQNPLLRAVGAQVNGRDVFGRPITGMERLENVIGSFGPPGEAALGVTNAITQGELSGAEAIRLGSGVAAVGNVATLPREADAVVAKMAAKVLRQAGLPDDKDRVYQLSRLMRQNFYQTGALYGGEINTWLAYQRRAYKRRGLPWLWQEGKGVLRDMAKE